LDGKSRKEKALKEELLTDTLAFQKREANPLRPHPEGKRRRIMEKGGTFSFAAFERQRRLPMGKKREGKTRAKGKSRARKEGKGGKESPWGQRREASGLGGGGEKNVEKTSLLILQVSEGQGGETVFTDPNKDKEKKRMK